MRRSRQTRSENVKAAMAQAFLKIPPFPGHRSLPLAAAPGADIDDETAAKIAQLMEDKRVGGTFWGDRPALPKGRDLLIVPASTSQGAEMLTAAKAQAALDRCVLLVPPDSTSPGSDVPQLQGLLDCWHLAGQAQEVWADANHELALVAALSRRPVRIFGEGRFQALSRRAGVIEAVRDAVGGWSYRSPFTGEVMTPLQAIELLAGWRALFDRNRAVSAIFGIANWKRPTLDAMLWDGSAPPRYAAELSRVLTEGSSVAAWKSRTRPALLDRLAGSGLPVAEVEDGLIRGRGLGANCVPPLSIVLDFSGIYFDPNQVSDLEHLLQSAEIDAALLARAARLRQMIVDGEVSKYGGGVAPRVTPVGKRRVLVVGQVEDDRSILTGGKGQTNLGLLQRARAIEPDSWLIYRPHPDVEAGHRKGHVVDRQALQFADEIERGSSIGALITTVDEVHCITSLAGFEALLRSKKVTTHGVPFYAGWGLTTDLGPVPGRRGRKRSLDELVAATLILYPTYFDPVTRLPCPPEVVVRRIARGEERVAAPLAGLRALQGQVKVALRRLRDAAA